MSAIQESVARVDGGQAAMARALQVSPQQVNQWVKGGRPVPPRHAIAIEGLTGVSRHELRPDVFGRPADTDPQPKAEISSGITKRALMRRLALVNETGLAVMLGLPREEVEAWGDDNLVPALPQVLALVQQPEAAAVPPDQADPDDSRIVPVEVA